MLDKVFRLLRVLNKVTGHHYVSLQVYGDYSGNILDGIGCEIASFQDLGGCLGYTDEARPGGC